ncbi:hypothetical protein KBT16_10050 [Nostoc sp. CCCryo 231-06]|nr:hypothetical protein [Nostoc sp. CCCryo 231-06]
MPIPTNKGESENSEIKQESYTDSNGDTHSHVTRTTETSKNNTPDPNSYQKGYVQGRNTEHGNQQADLAERDNNNANGGLVLGIIITSVLALVIGGVWYFSQQNNAPVNNIVPVVVPVPSKSSPTPSASAQPRTTIIERTREIPVVVPVPVPVPVPQQQVTPPSAPRQPNINITIPPQQPAAEKAPVTQPTPKATQSPAPSPTTIAPTSQNKDDASTNTVAPDTKSDTSKTTPPQ